MIFNSLSAGGTGVGIAVLFMIYELVPIILRFLNIGFINYKIKIFLGIVSMLNEYKLPLREMDSLQYCICSSVLFESLTQRLP